MVLLRYELAREAVLNSEYSAPLQPFWQSVFRGHFPKTPYLAIPKAERRSLWAQAFRNEPPKHLPIADPDAPSTGLFYTYRYISRDGLLAASFEEFESSGEEDLDLSCALIQLVVDFDYPDEVLKNEFSRLLKAIRKVPASIETKGRGVSVATALKFLAVARVWDATGNYDDAETFVSSKLPDLLYTGEKHWRGAKQKVAELLKPGATGALKGST